MSDGLHCLRKPLVAGSGPSAVICLAPRTSRGASEVACPWQQFTSKCTVNTPDDGSHFMATLKGNGMKRFSVGLAALLAATSAQAEKISWADMGCSAALVAEGENGFRYYFSSESEESMLCTAQEAKLLTRDIALSCEGGRSLALHVVDNERLIAGTTLLFRVTKDGPICD